VELDEADRVASEKERKTGYRVASSVQRRIIDNPFPANCSSAASTGPGGPPMSEHWRSMI
jgi:hypothetical protein